MLKKFISAIAALTITVAALPSALALTYPDVSDDAWYGDYVEEITTLNAFNGYEDGTFRPDDNITYQEFVKTVVSLVYNGELPELNEDYKISEFSSSFVQNSTGEDVSLEWFWSHRYAAWAQPYLDIAIETGLVTYDDTDYAYGGGFFITREQMAKMIARACDYLGKEDVVNMSSVEKNITDYSGICPTCRPFVLEVYAKGVMNGYEDGSFQATNFLTRAEAAAVLSRLVN